MTKELDLAVHTLATYPEMNNPIKMEVCGHNNLKLYLIFIYNYFKVGIEECLHIEFEYNKSKYHLKDVIVGKIYFLLVRSEEILLSACQLLTDSGSDQDQAHGNSHH